MVIAERTATQLEEVAESLRGMISKFKIADFEAYLPDSPQQLPDWSHHLPDHWNLMPPVLPRHETFCGGTF